MQAPVEEKTFHVSHSVQAAFTLVQGYVNRTFGELLTEAERTRLDVPEAQIQQFPRRVDLAFAYLAPMLKQLFVWLFTSRELTNFTYHLTEQNKAYLASLISVVTNVPVAQIQGYIDEVNQDEALRDHIRERTSNSPYHVVSDVEAKFGRRVGWYAFVRATKPEVVVETGVDKGLGACVLAAALMRNEADGFKGYYYGTEINREAGYLFSGRYARHGEILFGDSIESLRALDASIDLFINDSDHSADYEAREYEVVHEKLTSQAIVLGDNSHATDKLYRFATATGRRFLFFPERPADHWYPGAGIGVAFPGAR